MPPKSTKPQRLRQSTLFEATARTPSLMSTPRRLSRAERAYELERSRNSSSSDSDIERIKLTPAKTPVRPSSPFCLSSSDEEHASPSAPRIRQTKSRRIVTPPPDPGALESSDGEDGSPIKRRRLIRRQPSPGESSAAEDVADEVEPERILDCRFRKRGKMTAFQKSLDKLKRRKLKQESPDINDSDSDREVSQESDDDHEEATTTSSTSDHGRVRPFRGAKPVVMDESDDQGATSEHSDTSDFIVDDDEETPQLPPEFSMGTHEDLSHQFKIIFQFFCHIAIQPKGSRRDFMTEAIKSNPYFSVPLQVTRRKLDGLRDSLVVSSKWLPDYKTPFEQYPELEIYDLDCAVSGCDACRIRTRYSTRGARLSGEKYERLGFNIKSKKRKRKEEPEERMHFDIGRFCARRTQTFHLFMHWEARPTTQIFELFKSISNEIDELRRSPLYNKGKRRQRGFHRVAYAGSKEPPEDLTDADSLCDWLDSRHVVDQEWRKIRDMMERARHLDMQKDTDDD